MTGGFQLFTVSVHRSIFCRVCVVLAALTLRMFAAEETLLDQGEAALQREAYDEAIAVFDGLLRAEPTNVKAYIGRGRCYDGKKDTARALADYTEALRIEPKSKIALLYRYRDYLLQDEDEKALADINRVIELEPSDAASHLARARTYRFLKNYAAALADVEQATLLGQKRAEILEVRAEILANAKSYQEAIDDYSAAIGMNGKEADYFYQRGWLHGKTGRYREAIDDLREAIRLKKDDGVYCNDLAWTLATCRDKNFFDGAKAVELATRACELTSWQKPELLDTLAAASARAGDFENAMRWQAKALELNKKGDNVEAYRERLAQYGRKEAYTQKPADKDKVDWSLQRSACFDTVWTTVNENYFDLTFGGVDWKAMREKYRLRLWAAADNRALRKLLQDMLDELHRTHFAIIPREMAVLSPEERGRIGYTGAEVALIEDAVTIARVKPGSPAEKAALKPGDVVRRVGSVVLSEMAASMSDSVVSPRKRLFYLRSFVSWWLSAPVGTECVLQLEDAAGTLREVKLVAVPFEGVWSEPMGFTPSEPIECEIARGPENVVYLHFNIFALPAMNEFKRCVRSLQAGDGLIIDLRGNPGGLTLMAPGIVGQLTAKEVSLGTMHRRYGTEEFTAYPQRGAFSGPVAILVDSASASTSEILAAGLQEAGRARVFGEPTAGAALPSVFRKLPNGDMLQYAVADIKTPREILIEGNGVVPDEPVLVRRSDCLAGHDPVREAAVRWLATQQLNMAKEVVTK